MQAAHAPWMWMAASRAASTLSSCRCALAQRLGRCSLLRQCLPACRCTWALCLLHNVSAGVCHADLHPPLLPAPARRQDESASATQSFSGSGRRRTGPAPEHAPRQPRPAAEAAPSLTFGAMVDAGAGASATGPAGIGEQGRSGTPTAGAGTAAWQQAHAHLTGRKHRRETPAAAAGPSDAGKSGGRNGSDSGSNSPCDGGSPVPDSRADEEEGRLCEQQPPSKQQRR